MPPHRLTNFEIRRYYKNEPPFNGANSTNSLPKNVKYGTCAIGINECSNIGSH